MLPAAPPITFDLLAELAANDCSVLQREQSRQRGFLWLRMQVFDFPAFAKQRMTTKISVLCFLFVALQL